MSRLLKWIKSLFLPKGQGNTVKYTFSALVPALALLGAAVITATDASYIRLDVSSNAVEDGVPFLVDVYAFAHTPVNAVDITIEFDKAMFEAVSVDKGLSVLTIWTEEPVIESNKVILKGGTFRKGFVEEHIVASIKLKPKQKGSGSIRVSDTVLLAGDGKGTEVVVAEAQDSKISLFVYDENTTSDEIAANLGVSSYSDLDNDGSITLKDISIFMSAWGGKSKIYDFNNDNRMTFKDFSILLSDFFFK